MLRSRSLRAGWNADFSLRPYQRQSLAFMLQNEKSNDASLKGSNGARGGWLCDEVPSRFEVETAAASCRRCCRRRRRRRLLLPC